MPLESVSLPPVFPLEKKKYFHRYHFAIVPIEEIHGGLTLRTFDEFSDEFGCLAGQGFASQKFLSLPERLHLSRVSPIRLSDVAAKNGSSGDLLVKAFQEFPGIGPHLQVILFPDFIPAQKQSDGCQTSDDSSADLPVATQSSAERGHRPDQVVVLFSEFFLRDRKNGLASVKMFHEEVRGLFLHLQSSHLSSSRGTYWSLSD